MKIKVTPTDQEMLLATCNGLPPVEEWDRTETIKQGQHFIAVHQHFQDLKKALAAYFSGEANPIGKDDVKRKRLIEGEVAYYLGVYDLFWFGWSEIEAEVSQTYPRSWFPSSPGEALTTILELDCEAMLSAARGNQVNVRESKTLLSGSLPDPAMFHGLENKRALRTIEYADSVRSRNESGSFLNFCQLATQKRLRGNPTLRSKLKAFKCLQSKRFDRFRKLAHRIKGA
ncbi:hypothetical protein Q2T42_25730 [Leptolyngbya boryana CZ1]|uniref:Uncharacterized protein n=1 Tax=Leptolyngbya boryana CZ1 TaxID=3060204 RepID=A0AA97AVC6_LEPBY|nr:hypothetical protein [Leptolyngbya boryana]WNZ45191.1 hypothetical protein Q2T42_25730 [Leptolyngbya boryana CZ1]